ncbi:MAG: ABC transporter permease [Bradymonadales bacterium]|nr:ABC transporter permease [Bradymonadales bacterium]
MKRAANLFIVVGGVLVAAWMGIALLGPVVSPFPATGLDILEQLQGPSSRHWFGTDENGADLLTLILHGARIALVVGGSTVLLSGAVGVLVGALSGYFGGVVDAVFMRLTDVVMAFPGILLAILIIFVTQNPSLFSVVLALSVTGWAGYARIVRGQVLSERERPYVEAARSLGQREIWILFVHVLPNCMAPVLIQATFGLAGAILAEAALSFLGLGPQNTPSWGALLDQGVTYFLLTPHLAIFPGIAIALTVLGVNLLGDGLRDRLDPRHLAVRE